MSIINSKVANYLRKKNYNVDLDYYTYIELWTEYWKNTLDWLTYHDQTGKERKMYSLGMGKRIPEDWASIEFSERDKIKAGKKYNQEYLDEKSKELRLYEDLPIAIEKASALGTCGAILRVKNAKVENNIVVADERTKMDLIYVTADQIIPLKVEHGEIVDVAFCSETKIGDKKAYYIEIHELRYDKEQKKDIYWIKNIYIDADTGKEIKIDNIPSEYTLNTDLPIFSILKTPIANPIDDNNGMGLSMFANATDQIKAVDIAFNNFVMDFYLGGKKVFYNKKIMQIKTRLEKQADGSEKLVEYQVYPDDITRQQWATYGDEMSQIDDDPAVKEYNPDLRVTENKDGLQFALDILSFKCGLGTKYYQFNGSTVVTATQYIGDRQDLIINANKFRKNLDSFIQNICRGILLLGRILFKQNVTENDEIKLEDVDGFLVDTETMKKELRSDLSMGLISKKKYLMKAYRLTEEEALAELQEVENENKVNDITVE